MKSAPVTSSDRHTVRYNNQISERSENKTSAPATSLDRCTRKQLDSHKLKIEICKVAPGCKMAQYTERTDGS